MPDTPPLSAARSGKRKKIALLAASFYCVLLIAMVSYFLPLYYTHIGFSPQAAGWLVASFYLASVGSRLFLGSVILRFGFKRVFLLAGILSLISSVGVATAGPHFWLALISRAALGVGSSLFQVGLATYQALAFAKEERAGAYSIIMAGGLAPMMSAVPLADWLLFRGYDALYIFIPVAACILSLLVAIAIPPLPQTAFPEATPHRFVNPLRGIADCFKIPFFRLAIFSMFLFTATDATSAFMSPMTNSFGLAASFFLTANALVGVSVRLFLGRILDNHPRWKLSAPILILMLCPLLLASCDPSEGSLVALGMIFGIGMGFGFPLNLALVSDGIPPALQPQAIAMAWFVMGFNFGMVPLLLGWISGVTGVVTAFRIIAGLTLAGACLLGVLWLRHQRSKPQGG